MYITSSVTQKSATAVPSPSNTTSAPGSTTGGVKPSQTSSKISASRAAAVNLILAANGGVGGLAALIAGMVGIM